MIPEQKQAWDAYYVQIIQGLKSQNLEGDQWAFWKYDRYIKDYLSTVQSGDDGVGRLLDHLKENDFEENTIIVYTSDQGFYLGEHDWFDKRFMYEESFRTPLVMKSKRDKTRYRNQRVGPEP